MKLIICKDIGSASIISGNEIKKNCIFFLKNPAKKFFEEYLTRYYSNTLIYRLSNVFGEGEFIRGNTVYNMATEAKKTNKYCGVPKYCRRSWR